MNGYEVDRSLFGSDRDELLPATCPLDGEVDGLVAPLIPSLLELIVSCLIFDGKLEVRLEIAVRENGGYELVFINIGNFQLLLGDVGDVGCGGSGGGVLVLFVGEDFDSDDGGLGGSVLSGLGSGVLGDLAGETLEHAVASLLDITKGAGGAVG
jgi:hypothetical protein